MNAESVADVAFLGIKLVERVVFTRVDTRRVRYRNIIQIVEVQYIAALELDGCRAAGRLKMVKAEVPIPKSH